MTPAFINAWGTKRNSTPISKENTLFSPYLFLPYDPHGHNSLQDDFCWWNNSKEPGENPVEQSLEQAQICVS